MGAVYLKADPLKSPGVKDQHVFLTDNNHFNKMNLMLEQHYQVKEIPNTIIKN